VKSPRGQESPTLPFEATQIDAMLTAAESFNAKGRFKDGNRRRIRAMVLLLRYSGLRISDAAVLERARLSDDKLFLYTQKTGTPVICSSLTTLGIKNATYGRAAKLVALGEHVSDSVSTASRGAS
jgi:integrase